MRVGAGVLHYCFWPNVRRTLDALRGQTRLPDEIVVIDNGSGDGSTTELRKSYPDLELVEIPENRGPAAGMNLVIEALLGKDVDAILLVPHDCLMAPDAIGHLVERLEEDKSLGAVGPLLGYLSDPDAVWSAGGHIHRRTWDTGHDRDPSKVSEWAGRPPRPADWLDGTGLLLRATAARAAGPLNEDFFYFFDEADLLLRIRSLGWRVECVPAAVAWSEPGVPPPDLYVRNRLGFLARNAPKRYLAREILRVLFHVMRDVIHPRPGRGRLDAWHRLRGLADFLRRRWGRPRAPVGAPRAAESSGRS